MDWILCEGIASKQAGEIRLHGVCLGFSSSFELFEDYLHQSWPLFIFWSSFGLICICLLEFIDGYPPTREEEAYIPRVIDSG